MNLHMIAQVAKAKESYSKSKKELIATMTAERDAIKQRCTVSLLSCFNPSLADLVLLADGCN